MTFDRTSRAAEELAHQASDAGTPKETEALAAAAQAYGLLAIAHALILLEETVQRGISDLTPR